MQSVALLSGEGVTTALQNGFKAGEPFDCCILDIQMPGMNGYDVAEKIRDLESSAVLVRRLPLLALSSSAERAAQKCEKAEFDGFLNKPIRREKLYQMLQTLLGERTDEEEKNKPEKHKILTQYSIREEMKHSVHILLVEDNHINQMFAQFLLTKSGYKVEVADNGKQAVEKYTASSAGDFALIFMDVQMPKMDGLEATREIRKWEQGLKSQTSEPGEKNDSSTKAVSRRMSARPERIPIVAMTANAMKGDREICLEAGMDDYITKPIDREKIFDILEKWVFKKLGKN